MKYHKSRHSSHLLHVHIVLITKYRRKILGELHRSSFTEIARSVCSDFSANLIECNGENDHVHLLVDYPPSVQLTKLINSLKAVTSRRLRNEFIDLRGAYNKPVLWSRAYFVGSCGGATLDVVKNYIQNQQG